MSSKKVTTTVQTQKAPTQQRKKQQKNKPQKAKAPRVQKTSTITNVSTTMTTRKPKYVHRADYICIDHVEPIGVVVAQNGNNFEIVIDLDINPGDEKAFPWLSTQAKAWEWYRVRKLNYHYLARTGTLTSGEVVMAPDYDINDQIPDTIEELTQNQDSVSSTAFKDFSCRLNPSSLMGGQTKKLVRGFVPRANFDQGRYDVGSFYVALSGLATNPSVYPLTIGRVYVEYSIEFFVPVGNRTAQPVTSSILSFGNTPNLVQENLPGNLPDVVARPANLILNGLESVLSVDTPTSNRFTALQDTVLKVSGMDQFVAQATGTMNTQHWFKKFDTSTGNYDTIIGGTSAIKAVTLNDQIDSSFDFSVPLKKGESFRHFYDTQGGVASTLGGLSSLNFQDISRNFLSSAAF